MASKGKELSDDLKDSVVELHKCGLGYKKVSNRDQISANTIAKIVQMYWCLESKISGRTTFFDNKE